MLNVLIVGTTFLLVCIVYPLQKRRLSPELLSACDLFDCRVGSYEYLRVIFLEDGAVFAREKSLLPVLVA